MIISKFIFFSFALLFCLGNSTSTSIKNKGISKHPFYVSVTEIDENIKEKILEVSCKFFTDDLEKTLRMHYPNHIDLLNPTDKAVMDALISDYVEKHLKIWVDGKLYPLEYVGYEKAEDGIECYFQVNNISVNKTVAVFNDLLFEYKPEQTNIVHVTVKGTRKSRQLINPNTNLSFDF